MESKSLSFSYERIQSIQTSYDNSKESNKFEYSNSNNQNTKNLKMLKKIQNLIHKKVSSIITLEKLIFKKFHKKYSKDNNYYNIKIINEIICNENTHIVAEFKDYLIKGDYSEFLQRSYITSECKNFLPKIFEYYDSCSVIFPNYVALPESKYIYKNIQRKQRVIDNQQDLEDKKEKIKKGLIKEKLYNERFFNGQALDSILEQTDTSGIQKFFGVKGKDNDSNNISLENIINKIINAENNHKLINERKSTNTTLKKMKDINVKKIGINLNFNIINSKIKGRNYNRYLNGGYNYSSSNNINQRKNTLFNVNNTTSNGMKNTKVSSTTIDIDLKNINNQNYNTSLNIPSRKIKNKNNLISNYHDKKTKIIQSLFTNNNKDYIFQFFKEKKKTNLNSSDRKKSIKRNIKSFSPINQSLSSKNKITNINKKNNNKHLSPSSSINNQISSYNNKKTNSNPKIGKILDKMHKSTISHSNSKEKNTISQKKNKLKEISIPMSERDFFRKYHQSELNLKKNKHKNNYSSKKSSMSLPSDKKKVLISSNNNKKENKEKSNINGIKNIKNIFNREVLYNNTNHQNINSNICKRNINLNTLSISPDNNLFKSYNNFNNEKNKNKFNTVFSNKNIKGIQIKGFKHFQKNSISRNNSNTERIIFKEALINKIGKSKQNKNHAYSKTYFDLNKKKF